MNNEMTVLLTRLNQTYKEMDKLYHNYAKAFDLSDTTFWLLYVLWEHGDAYPQRELCEEWSFPPQTANSALKNLEKQGLVELTFAEGNRKNKNVCFTDAGRVLAEKVIRPLIQAENTALWGLAKEEQEAFLTIMKKHTTLLGKEIDTIYKEKKL